jgi:hypothetical protein
MERRGFGVLVCVLAAGLIAVAATGDSKDRFTARQRNYWAFQSVHRPEQPQVKRQLWVRNPIDAFILAKLEAKDLVPSPEADKITLLRRVSFDLIGLPPSDTEVSEFVADRSSDAYEKVVDRLLASPQYGERWARHWLDLARYADSDGFKADHTRPNIWRYRDYVIGAFNTDEPYDRFVREQIAGDELWPGSFEARIATGFNRHYAEEYNAQNLRQRRQDTLNDITDTVGSVFLGMTFGCARCHDHKFDPILQEDYYKLQAFFANVSAVDDVPLLPADQLAEYRRKLTIWEQQTKPIRDQIEALLEPGRQKLMHSRFIAYNPDVQAVVEKPESERTPIEHWMYHRTRPFLTLIDEPQENLVKKEDKERYEKLKAELAQFSSVYPGDLPTASCMTELGSEAPPTSTLAVGLIEKPIKTVDPGFLTILNVPPPKIEPPQGLSTTGRRTALANWLVDPANPLTARVMVNRIWHYHFGRGLVSTPSDFGIMGTRPSHPELLDWLADEFVRSGWSVKHLHRLILMSSAYRQSTAFREDAAKIDSSNKLLWRFPRQRLDAEAIRDSSLYVSGLLDFKAGGPGVYPELPIGMQAPRGGWDTASSGGDRNRRSIYIFVRRNSRYPMLEVFDLASTQEACPRRDVTTTAPQALTLLNSKLSREWAEALAGRVIGDAGPSFPAEVERAFRLTYSRPPDAAEKDTALTFLNRQLKILAERDKAGEPISQPKGPTAAIDRLQAAALVDFCQALMNSNEFVYSN